MVFAMRLTDGLAVPSVIQWGAVDFAAVDPAFDPLIHDQVPLRTDVAEVPGVPTRYHRAVIVAPDVVDYTLQEMSQAEKDAVDLVVEAPFSSILDFSLSSGELIVTSTAYVSVGSVCLNLTKLIADPALLNLAAAFAYTSTGTLELRFHAETNGGAINLQGARTFPASVAFDRVRTGVSDPMPVTNEIIEYALLARVGAVGDTATVRSLTMAFIQER